MNIDEQKRKHIEAEMLHITPFPIEDDDLFAIQIWANGKHTRFISINSEQFKAVERALLGD